MFKESTIIKKVFLLWILFISLAAASRNLSQLEPHEVSENCFFTSFVTTKSTTTSVGERIEDWKLDGDFGRIYDSGTQLNRSLLIRPAFETSVIRYVVLSGYVDNRYAINIFTINYIDSPVEFKQKFNDKKLDKRFFTEKSEDFSALLEFFYRKQYLPDIIINLIFQKMTEQKVLIADFRTTPQN